MGSVALAAEKLVHWHTASLVGGRVAGSGPELSAADRRAFEDDFAAAVPRAEQVVRTLTGLEPGTYPSRPWVMSRQQWLDANLRGFERILEPFAQKILASKAGGSSTAMRRHVLGAQIGGLLGYLGHRVLGQYDAFAPPDDDGLIYFVAPNIAGMERRFNFPGPEFRLWVAMHEVTHRLQFGGVPWLRGYLGGMIERYLGSVEVDPRWLLDRVESAFKEIRSGSADIRGFGWVFLLMSHDQREMVRRMQAVMSLLEGHATYVMNAVVDEHVPHAPEFHAAMNRRRHQGGGVDKAFQRVIGFDVKVRQYDQGARFVTTAIERAGMERFNRIWESSANLPTIEEIANPDAWVARVAAS